MYPAAAIRLNIVDSCLSCHPPEKGFKGANIEKGDRLLRDKGYFEGDPLDDQGVY